MNRIFRTALLGGLVALAAVVASPRPAAARQVAPPPPPISLPFRGWALTVDYQLAKVYGNATQYTVKWYADLSGLPWDTHLGESPYGGLAADPWNPNYLYLSVPTVPVLDDIYRFDLTSNTASYVVTMPSVSNGWTLQGLGSRCSSKLANLYGGVPFYSHRRFHPATSFNVRELTTAPVEGNAYTSSDGSSREGDNSQNLNSGTHWFTWVKSDPNAIQSWGVTQLSPAAIVMGTNDGREPTGLLGYGGTSFYVSTDDNRMYIVNTSLGTSGPLTYVATVGSYVTPPDIADLANPTNSCPAPQPPIDNPPTDNPPNG